MQRTELPNFPPAEPPMQVSSLVVGLATAFLAGVLMGCATMLQLPAKAWPCQPDPIATLILEDAASRDSL